MLGKALGKRRSDVVVSTKIGVRVDGKALIASGSSPRLPYPAWSIAKVGGDAAVTAALKGAD